MGSSVEKAANLTVRGMTFGQYDFDSAVDTMSGGTIQADLGDGSTSLMGMDVTGTKQQDKATARQRQLNASAAKKNKEQNTLASNKARDNLNTSTSSTYGAATDSLMNQSRYY